jgi:hypothetical protein
MRKNEQVDNEIRTKPWKPFTTELQQAKITNEQKY